jgi:large subunit ribosomal protein L25
MKADVKFKAQKRELTGKQCDKLRRENVIPAVIYGKEMDTVNIKIDNDNMKVLRQSFGSTSILEIKVGKKKYNAMLKNIQYHPVTDKILHIDFLNLKEGRPVEVDVPIRAVGVPEAVKSGIGVLVRDNDTVRVRAAPESIPEFLEVDVSGLEKMSDTILFDDIEVGDDMEIVEKSKEYKVAFVIARAQKVIEVEDIKEEEELTELVEGEEGELGEIIEEGELPEGEVLEGEEGELIEDIEPTPEE